MKKISLLFVIAALFCTKFFAHETIMLGMEGKLRIVKTEHFDIIYAPGSERSAQILYEKADGLYEELCKKYMVPHPFRITVSISPAHEDFNALFTCFPYNAIVIYDTMPEDEMLIYSENLINTFRHELIHAVSYNSKNTFWDGIGKVFGDTVNPAIATTTLGFAEGATVSTESDGGEGRMNNEFHLEMVRQAKIEEKFPKYSDIQGSRDIFPTSRTSYYFGGAFSEYLQKKYGYEKYAQFWYNATNVQKLGYWFYFSNFKIVYGISIKEAWEDFYQSIRVPDVKKYSWEEAWCEKPEGKNFGAKELNCGRSFYSNLTGSEKGWAWYDEYKSTIYYTSNAKTKKIALLAGVSNLSLSPDGRFLCATYKKSDCATSKRHVKIFDLENHKSLTLPETGLKSGTIFTSGAGYYAACVKFHSQESAIKIYRLTFSKKGSLKSVLPQKEFKAPFETVIYSPSGAPSGKLFFALKMGKETYLCAWDTETNKIRSIRASNLISGTNEKPAFWKTEFDNCSSLSECAREGGTITTLTVNAREGEAFSSFTDNAREGSTISSPSKTALPVPTDFSSTPDRIIIQNLNASEKGRVTFSFTERGSLPRLGILEYSEDLENISVKLSEGDSSGGIHYPIFVDSTDSELDNQAELENGGNGQKIAFIANFFEERNILFASQADMEKSLGFRTVNLRAEDFSELVEKNYASRESAPEGGTITTLTESDREGGKVSSFTESDREGGNISSVSEIAPEDETIFTASETAREGEKISTLPNSKPYSALVYTFTGPHGLFLPASLNASYYIANPGTSQAELTPQFLMPVGLTYASASPWTSPIWILSCGLSLPTYSGSFFGMMYGARKYFTYSMDSSVELGKIGIKQTRENLKITVPVNLGSGWYLNLSDTSSFFYGRSNLFAEKSETQKSTSANQNKIEEISLAETFLGVKEELNPATNLFNSNTASLALGNIRRLGPGSYESGGIQIMPFWLNKTSVSWLDGVYQNDSSYFYSNFGLDFVVQIPRLLPFRLQKTTLNLPCAIEAALFPEAGTIAAARGTAVLFSTELQSSTNSLPLLYANRLTILLDYLGNFLPKEETLPSYACQATNMYLSEIFEGDAVYRDELSLELSLSLTPNIGGFARSFFQFSMSTAFLYRFNPKENQSNVGFSIFGVTMF